MATTDFGPEVEMLPFLSRTRTEKRPKTREYTYTKCRNVYLLKSEISSNYYVYVEYFYD